MVIMKTQLCFLQVLTPLHVGIGTSSAGIVDMPIAREKATGWPTLPASGFKGVLKANYEGDKKDILFGAATQESEIAKPGAIDRWQTGTNLGAQESEIAKPGAIAFTDGRLLALPVRSYAGTFAYCTSLLVLQRLARDCDALEAENIFRIDFSDDKPLVTSNSKLTNKGLLVLQDLDFKPETNAEVNKLAAALANRIFDNEKERHIFIERFAIIPDNQFDYLCETATEIAAHVTLEEKTKTAKDGGLRYEETLPAEAIFVSFQRGKEEHLATLSAFEGKAIQIGGNASTGCGLCRIKIGGDK